MATYEYKVLTQKDKFFSRKFDPEQLQAALNSYANEGWRLVTAATAEIGAGIGSREEMIFMLERERPQANVMEELGGLKGNFHAGIFFSEQSSGATTLKQIAVKKNRQNFTLVQIKDMMAVDAKAVGANAIVDFRYGQRSHKWYQLAFQIKWDTEAGFGEGRAVSL